jgi:hypothetical protein
MVRDLDIEETPRGDLAPPRGPAAAAVATRAPDRSKLGRQPDGTRADEAVAAPEAKTTPAAAPEEPEAPPAAQSPAADATPEELVLKEKPARRPSGKRPRNRRHGRRR